MHPILEAEHQSSIAQHLNGSCCVQLNTISGGVRIVPEPGVTLDIIEGYSLNNPISNGNRDVFSARITIDLMGGERHD